MPRFSGGSRESSLALQCQARQPHPAQHQQERGQHVRGVKPPRCLALPGHGHGGTGARPVKATKMVKCQTWQVAGEAEGAGLLQPGEVKRRLRRGLIAGHSCLTRGCREDKARLFLEAIQQKATSTRWKVGSYNKLYGKYSADEGGEAQAALCDLHPWRSRDSAGHIPEQLDLLRAALSRNWTRGLRRSLPASVFLWFSVGSTDLRTDKNRITVLDKLAGEYMWQ